MALKVKGTDVVDLLTLHDRRNPRKRGFLTRTCFYWYVAMTNTSQVGFSSITELQSKVLKHKRVQEAVDETLNIECSNPPSRDQALVKVETTVQNMIGTVTSRVIKFCGWIYLTLLKQVCGSVQFNPKQIEVIKEISEKSCPIVYMPLHFSHLDYILLSLILFHNNVKVPYIASGNNLHLPVIGYFIKRAGGFFIRRKIESSSGKDLIYRAILQVYITELLKDGQSIEVFIEGTRSRSGLPKMPKTGFMSVLVDAVIEGTVSDVTIVPVHTSYEKLLEGNFNDELLGKPKNPESLWDTCKSVAKLFFGHYGNIKINFAKPISLKAALKDVCEYTCSDPPNLFDEEARDDLSPMTLHRKNISDLAEHIVYHGMVSGSFMSSHLIAYLLVNQFRDGVYLEELIDAYCYLKIQISSKGRDLGFSGNAQTVVLRALDLFNDEIVNVQCIDAEKDVNDVQYCGDTNNEKADSGIFVNDHDVAINIKSHIGKSPTLFIKPTVAIPSIFELSYYANALTPLFAIESVICLSVNAVSGFRFSVVDGLWKIGDSVDLFEDSLPQKMKTSFRRSTLVEKSIELCDLLQLDLILCDVLSNLEDCIQDRVQELISSGCLTSTTIGSRKPIHPSYGIDDDYDVANDELLKVNSSIIPQVVSFQSVLSPYVEALSIVVEHLPVISEPTYRKDFLAKLVCYAQGRVKSGLVTRVECCSSEVLVHCIKAFEQNCIIQTIDGRVSIPDQVNDAVYLNTLLSKVQAFMM